VQIRYDVRISGSGTQVSLEVDGTAADTGGGQVPATSSDEGTGQVPSTMSDEGSGQVPATMSDEGSGQVPEMSSDQGTGIPGACCGTTVVIGPTIVTSGMGRGSCCAGSPRGRSIPVNPQIIERLEGRPDPAEVLGGMEPGKDIGRVTGMRMNGQEQTNWCWAAVGAAIQESVTTTQPYRQCRVADLFSDAQDACDSPELYNRARSLAAVLRRLGRLYFVQQAAIASFDLIRSEIEQDRPVCARIAWDPSRQLREDGAHFIAIGGWTTRGGTRRLLIYDPFTGGVSGPATRRVIEWNDLRTVYKSYGRWVTTYFVENT
jgi:hypothetical protein